MAGERQPARLTLRSQLYRERTVKCSESPYVSYPKTLAAKKVVGESEW